jgi:hypothetical protein
MNAVMTYTEMRNDPKYYTQLTRYALACGYIERYAYEGLRYQHSVRIYMQCETIFVRTERDELLYCGRDLTQARAAFDVEKRAILSVFRK